MNLDSIHSISSREPGIQNPRQTPIAWPLTFGGSVTYLLAGKCWFPSVHPVLHALSDVPWSQNCLFARRKPQNCKFMWLHSKPGSTPEARYMVTLTHALPSWISGLVSETTQTKGISLVAAQFQIASINRFRFEGVFALFAKYPYHLGPDEFFQHLSDTNVKCWWVKEHWNQLIYSSSIGMNVVCLGLPKESPIWIGKQSKVCIPSCPWNHLHFELSASQTPSS